MSSIYNLLFNLQILVQKEKNKNSGCKNYQNRPHRFVSIDSEFCILILLNNNTTFRSTSIKPYLILIELIKGIDLPELTTKDSNQNKSKGTDDIIIVEPLSVTTVISPV